MKNISGKMGGESRSMETGKGGSGEKGTGKEREKRTGKGIIGKNEEKNGEKNGERNRKKRGKERGKEREWEERRLVENRFRMETTVDLPHGLTPEITIDLEKIYIAQRVKRNSLDISTIVAKTA